MNKIMILILLNIFIIIISVCSVYAQTEIDISQKLHFRNSMQTDSIFEYFEYPKIPTELKFPNYYWQDILIAADVSVDTNNKVSRICIYRLYEYENDTISELKIWNILSKCILDASKKWIFKDVKWKIPKFEKSDYGLVEYLKKSNLKKISMPFTGHQNHIIIFHFINDLYDGDIPFLYQINVE